MASQCYWCLHSQDWLSFLQTENQNQQPRQSDTLLLKPLWQGIWSLKVPSKVKNLIWRVAKNSLPTKQNLVRRKIINNDYYEHYQSQHEDVLHALYLYPKLKERCPPCHLSLSTTTTLIWFSILAWNLRNLWQTTNFVDLIGCIMVENRDPELFAMVVWALWKRRNELRVDKSCETLTHLMQQAHSKLREFSLHNTSMVEPVGRPPTQWQPPEHQQYKINFDGALFKAKNYAGIGVIIRDSERQVMVSMFQQIPLPNTTIEVEALATRRTMELALEIGLNKGVLEADLYILMNVLTTNSHSLSQFGHIVNDIQYLACHFSIISYSHVRRHRNTVAHSLTRRAISFSSL